MKLINLNIGIGIDNSKKVWEFIKNLNPNFISFQEITINLQNNRILVL